MTHPSVTENASWGKVVDSVRLIPAEYLRRAEPESVVQVILRCELVEIDRLVGAGLPFKDHRSGVRYSDAKDLYNLGMYSNASKTQPELAFRLLFRFASRLVDALLCTKSWDFRVRLEYTDCAGDASWRLEGPDVVRFGGSVASLTAPEPGSRSAEYAATVTTTSARTPVVSPVLRGLTRECMAVGYRWPMIPVPMQADYKLVHSLGMTSCIAASLFLTERFRAAGVHGRGEARLVHRSARRRPRSAACVRGGRGRRRLTRDHRHRQGPAGRTAVAGYRGVPGIVLRVNL